LSSWNQWSCKRLDRCEQIARQDGRREYTQRNEPGGDPKKKLAVIQLAAIAGIGRVIPSYGSRQVTGR
jgi:hypothetical protein